MKKRIMAILLCFCMVAVLLPTTAFAAGTGAIQSGAGGIAKNNKVYFGQKGATVVPWIALDDSGFLLSEYTIGTSNFRDGDDWGYYNYSTKSNTADSSKLKDVMDGLYNGSGTTLFSDLEQGAVEETTLAGDSMYMYDNNTPPVDAYLFPLSFSEAKNIGWRNKLMEAKSIDAPEGSAGWWWLRSSDYIYYAFCVAEADDYPIDAVYTDVPLGVRPAFNLNLNSVLFTSAAVGGKSSGTVGAAALNSVSTTTPTEWKLTLLDSGRSFTASTSSDTTARVGYTDWSIDIAYSGAKTGANEYVSAMLVDSSNNVLYYGNIAQNSASNTTGQTVNIPTGLAAGTYTLKVFSEQCNGDKQTDYASEFKDITITVSAADTTAPTLTAGVANRTGDTAAAVKFTSDEAGAYYYAVVDSGAAAPTIDTTGAGTACDTTEQTIAATLTAGAKDIYIVVKDAAGNVSNALKIAIPAYVPNAYTIAVSPVSLPFGSAYTSYAQPTAQTVTITNTGNQSITLTQPTATNYDVGTLSTTSLAANGDTATFTVTPKTGLGVGAHNETITVSGTNGASASVAAAFTVQQQGGSGGNTTDYYTLTFDTNGGSSVSSVRRAEYTTINLSSYTPTKDGYTFTGWYSDKALTEKITSIRLTKDTTIYAGWNRTNPQTGVWDNPFSDVSENDWFYGMLLSAMSLD